jgi:hypothetical protein
MTAMSGWRRLGWICAAVLAAAEYSWLSVVDRAVPPLPQFMVGVQALLFPAAVFAMLGAVTFVAALVYMAARRRPTSPADYLAATLGVGLMVVILRW